MIVYFTVLKIVVIDVLTFQSCMSLVHMRWWKRWREQQWTRSWTWKFWRDGPVGYNYLEQSPEEKKFKLLIIGSEVSKMKQWFRNGHHIQYEYNSVENSDINFTKWQKKKKNEMKNKISALFRGEGIKMKCNFF